ncbi:hypothetical protein ACWC10_11350 [Streptomyces sp. NPDC001595]
MTSNELRDNPDPGSLPVARFQPPVHRGGDPGGANGRTGRRGISPARVMYGVDMGVFARLFRRSKATEEASTAEAQADTSAGSEAKEAAAATESAATESAGSAEAGTDAKTDAATETDTSAATDTAEAGAADESGASDAVGIPQQQSAAKAADNEADKNAHT